MQYRSTILALHVSFFLLQAPAWAILIETGPKQRVGGFLEREDARQITVRYKTPDGKDKAEVFDLFKVKVIHKVDRKRLEKLSKDQPKAFRDYAVELAKTPNDPEAMELALRLNLIAAHLDPANLGRSCLLNMAGLATQPADVRKYRAMAYLLDPKNDAALLKTETGKAAPPPKTTLKTLTAFQKALKLYRAGDVKNAKVYANETGVAEFFGKAGVKDQRSFIQACNDVDCSKCKAGNLTCTMCKGKKFAAPIDPFDMVGGQPCTACDGKGTQKCKACDGSGKNAVPDDYFKDVLRAEIWALEQMNPAGPATKKGAPVGWDNAVSNPQASIALMTLENITAFDPRKCVYRNGAWEAP